MKSKTLFQLLTASEIAIVINAERIKELGRLF